MKLLLEGGITDIEIFEILLSNNHQGVRNKQHLHHNNLFHFYIYIYHIIKKLTNNNLEKFYAIFPVSLLAVFSKESYVYRQ